MCTTTDWLQVGLLALNAGLVYKYLRATELIARTNQDQVTESQALVEAAKRQFEVGQQQVEASHQQLEGLIRPALIVAVSNEVAKNGTTLQRLLIRNVGNGPALNLRRYQVYGDAAITWVGNSVPVWDFEGCCVPVQYSPSDPTHPEDWHLVREAFSGSSRNVLHLLYQSLSGKDHASVIEFDIDGSPLRTHFEQRTPA